MEKLNEDLLTNIFIQFPAKHVGRMRCVSKPWNALLSQPFFVKSHLHHSLGRNKNKDDEILLVFSYGFFYQECYNSNNLPCTAHLSGSPNIKLTDLIKLPVNFPLAKSADDRGNVIGSVNGLICFYCGSCFHPVIYIWNPSLSAVMTVPPFTRPSSRSHDLKFSFKFGFDPKTDDYKVVKLMRDVRKQDKLGWFGVELYSMRKNSWKLVTERFPSDVRDIFVRKEVCIDGHDGHIHWFCCSKNDDHMIIAFDLGAEIFTKISLPDSINKCKWDRFDDLAIFGGKLCVMSYIFGGEVEVWVMNEYGVVKSWMKHLVLSKLTRKIYPIGFTSNNEFIFEAKNRLALYDPDTTNVKHFGFDANHLTRIVPYVDSLVWIAPTNQT